MWFDSHAHITSLNPLLVDEVMQRAKASQVRWIMNICTSNEELKRATSLQEKYPCLYMAGATTPHDVEKQGLEFPFFEKAAKEGQLKAIGETGLDYHYEYVDKKVQREFFFKYIDLALCYQLPLIIHCREAFTDLLAILDAHYLGKSRAKDVILHCFTGTEKEAHELTQRGIFLSFSGIATFKNSDSLRKVIQNTEIEKMLIETDTPYLAPVPMRGKANEPSFVSYIGRQIAEEKNKPFEEVALITSSNARRIFQVDGS